MRAILSLVAGAVLLAGCANSQQTEALRAEAQRTTPHCLSEDECQVMWSAARRWVLNNAGTKIQNYGVDYFDTYNPMANSPRLAAQVSKEAIGSGKYRIVAKLWCDNIFGCQPDSWQALLDFNRSVSSSVGTN